MTSAEFVQSHPINYTEKHTTTSVFKKLMQWCEDQQPDRLLWLGIILAAHGCILTPLTLMAAFFAGTASLSLVMTAIVAMGIAVVTNLAALPTKITIPAFLLSIVMDIAIIMIAAAI